MRGQATHRHDVALVAVGMGLDACEHNAQRLLVAVRLVQRVAPILGPARLPIIAAQNCNTPLTPLDRHAFVHQPPSAKPPWPPLQSLSGTTASVLGTIVRPPSSGNTAQTVGNQCTSEQSSVRRNHAANLSAARLTVSTAVSVKPPGTISKGGD